MEFPNMIPAALDLLAYRPCTRRVELVRGSNTHIEALHKKTILTGPTQSYALTSPFLCSRAPMYCARDTCL